MPVCFDRHSRGVPSSLSLPPRPACLISTVPSYKILYIVFGTLHRTKNLQQKEPASTIAHDGPREELRKPMSDVHEEHVPILEVI